MDCRPRAAPFHVPHGSDAWAQGAVQCPTSAPPLLIAVCQANMETAETQARERIMGGEEAGWEELMFSEEVIPPALPQTLG